MPQAQSKGATVSSSTMDDKVYLSLQEIQNVSLKILNEIDGFCEERGIPYFIIGGALIGALRNQDLLAWDDDIDVGMKREDYERFCREYKDHDEFQLLTYENQEDYRHGLAKLVDKSTVFIEPNVIDGPFGVFVDLFPLDEVKSPTDSYVSKMIFYKKMYYYCYEFSAEARKESKIKSLARTVLSATLGRGDFKKHIARLDKAIQMSDGDYIINFWGWDKDECSHKRCFDGTTPITIRGRQYPAPIGYDEFLTDVFGDYMTPPENPPEPHGFAYRNPEYKQEDDN